MPAEKSDKPTYPVIHPVYATVLLLVIFAALLGVLASKFPIHRNILSTSTPGPYIESSGQVVMEAENYDAKIDRSSVSWTPTTTVTGFVGASYMQALPDSGKTFLASPYSTISPELQYQVNFATTGTYYVWIRDNAPDQSGDSVHVGLDGIEQTSADKINQPANATWAWTNSTSDGIPATLIISTAGLHTINMWMREDGDRVDRLLLTTSSTYTPLASEPESPRSVSASPTATPTPHPISCDFKDAHQDDPNNAPDNYIITSANKIPVNSIVQPGTKLVYHFSITNSGQPVSAVTLTDPLPSILTFFDSDNQCIFDSHNTPGSVICNLGSLATGANTQIAFRVTVNQVTTNTRITNTAFASADGNITQSGCSNVLWDGYPPTPTPTFTPTPTPVPSALSTVACAEKQAYQDDPRNTPGVYYFTTPIAPNSNVPLGTTLVYYIKVTNAGPGAGSNATISDPIPANTTFLDAGSGCSFASGTVTCNLGTFAVGGAGSKAVRVKLISGSGLFANTASVNATENLSPSTCSFSLAAINPAPIAIEAESGTLTSPFVSSGSYISQPASNANLSDPTQGGLATYTFTINQPGQYKIVALAKTPNNAANNSFFINMDADPTLTSQIWDIYPYSPSAFTLGDVSWKGTSTNPDADAIDPKLFTLSAGSHTLYIRGREANAQLDQLQITYVSP